VLRCREGRTSYLGTISFFAMMIPLSCIVLNEYIGEKLVNLVIGGMYSALLVAGADLYSMSLPTLLFPICIVAGLIMYYHCFFLPARMAIIRRQEKLRKIRVQRETVTVSAHWRMKRQFADGTPHASNRPCSYLRRVMSMIKHAAQSGISACSGNVLHDRRVSEVVTARAWCDMNRAPGGVSEPSVEQATPAPPPTFMQSNPLLFRSMRRSSSRQITRQQSFLPPMPIQNMMTSINAHRALRTAETAITHRTATVLRRQSALFGIMDDEFESAKDDQFVITRSDRTIATTRRPAATILFEAADALVRMKALLAGSAPRDSEDTLHVTEVDLDREFRAILDIFYPDGIMLSEVERDEAYESFTHWLNNKSPPEVLRWTEAAAPIVPVVSFESFERWFIEELLCTLHNIMTDRLMNSPSFTHKLKIRSALSFARSASSGGGGGSGDKDRVGRSNSGITLGPARDRRMSYEYDSDRSCAEAPWIMARENSK
jgi:hypothetical protein